MYNHKHIVYLNARLNRRKHRNVKKKKRKKVLSFMRPSRRSDGTPRCCCSHCTNPVTGAAASARCTPTPPCLIYLSYQFPEQTTDCLHGDTSFTGFPT